LHLDARRRLDPHDAAHTVDATAAGVARTRHRSRSSATTRRPTPHSTRPTYTSQRRARAATMSAH
jgi:hypothetical protein